MKIFPTCEEVHRLTSEQLDRKLSRKERSRQRFHLFLCGGCRNFVKQMALLRQAMCSRSLEYITKTQNDASK